MSSNKKSNEVVEPKADEKVTAESPVIASPQESDVNPIAAKIASLSEVQKTEIEQFKRFKKLFTADKVVNDEFKKFAQIVGLYESSSNVDEVKRLQDEVDQIKAVLTTTTYNDDGSIKFKGFAEDHFVVQSAIKGLIAELGKAEKEVKDNLPDLAKYFNVRLAKSAGSGRVYAATGDLATHRPNLAELKTTDYLFSQQDKKAVVIHTSTIATAELDKLGVKADSQTWIAFEYNGYLQYNRNSDGKGRMISQVTSYPENWVKAYPVVCTSEKLSGLIDMVATTLGLNYNGNGWQSNSELNPKFNKITRVVKA